MWRGKKPGNGPSGKVGVILEDLHLALKGFRHNGEHGSFFRAHQFGVGGHSSSMQLRSQFSVLRASVTSRARKRQEAASGGVSLRSWRAPIKCPIPCRPARRTERVRAAETFPQTDKAECCNSPPPESRTGRRSWPGFQACLPDYALIWSSSTANCTGASWATDAGGGRKSRKTAPRRWPACATGKRSARRSRCASRIAIGPIGNGPWRWKIARKTGKHGAR